jgi:fatty-acyl-CoA synthase
MNGNIERTPSAHQYGLLIKNLLFSPIEYDPDREIVYRGDIRISYAKFRERVGRLAQTLISLGVKQGDTVAVMDWDSHRYLECYFAIPMIGAVLHTVNARLSPEQLVYTIGHAEDDVFLLNADFLPIIESIKGRLETVKQYVLLSDAQAKPETHISFAGEYEALLAANEPLTEFPDFDENARATTFYTTGTTGLPKGVYFSHRQLVLHTMATTASLSSNRAACDFHSDDVYMPITPMFHVHAWGIPYVATFLGVKQVYPGKYVPPALLDLIRKEGVTFSHCVPTILAMLLKDPTSASVDLSKWKCVIGGAALPKALCALALDRGIDIFAGYGMSETCPVLSLVRVKAADLAKGRDEQIALRCRTGVPVALVELRTQDAQGKQTARDDKSGGEVVVRTPWLTQGYLKDRVNSEKLWAGGWLHTQDVAARDAHGSLRITDRLKDVIKVGGEWLSSLEVEDILSSHPSVAEAAVIGRSDEKWGEVPLGVVALKPGAEASEHRLIEHVKSYIDRGLIPREAVLLRVAFIEAIPKTSVGKTDKLSLREKFAKA